MQTADYVLLFSNCFCFVALSFLVVRIATLIRRFKKDCYVLILENASKISRLAEELNGVAERIKRGEQDNTPPTDDKTENTPPTDDKTEKTPPTSSKTEEKTENTEYVFSSGRYKGCKASEVPEHYLRWLKRHGMLPKEICDFFSGSNREPR